MSGKNVFSHPSSPIFKCAELCFNLVQSIFQLE